MCLCKQIKKKTFLHENNRHYNSYKFNHKVVFIPFLSFQKKLKQESNFLQVGGLVLRKIARFGL